MIGFLRQMSLPNITNVKERAEDWKVNERFDFVTGRALAPLSAQLELSARPCRIKKLVVPMRASSDRESFENVDLEPLGLKFIETVERPLPGTDVVRLFPIYQKVAKTKIGFPRRWAEIKAYPL
jgi:16S rRNA (guanine527-N7)-methyltransferase